MSRCYPISSVASGRCGPKSSIGASTIEELVEEYRKAQKNPEDGCESLYQLLRHYKGLKNLKEVIECAAYARNSKRKRHGHQRRIRSAPMEEALKILKANIRDKNSFESFDKMHEWFAGECAKIKGLGELYAYDTCLRIGAYLGLMPKRVYLHAGALVGARALGVAVRNKELPVRDFLPALRNLKPHEIEDFLCVFKDQLKKFKPLRSSGVQD